MDLVAENDIVTLRADWTDGSPEVERWLKKFDSISIPLTAIFPANRPYEPIIIRDLYTRNQLLQSLKQAVSAKPSATMQANGATLTSR